MYKYNLCTTTYPYFHGNKITFGIMNEVNINRAYRKEKPEPITESLEFRQLNFDRFNRLLLFPLNV